jgi:AcrR family transcriptional regulator
VSATRPRLAAEERRADLIDCGCRVFSRGSYRGTTTAEIARESGVTEPILYRHFGSKRDLYLACLDEAWTRVRTAWEAVIAAEPDPAEWTAAMGRAFTELKERKVMLHNLWVQSLAEASEDPEIRKYLRRHLRDVHAFVTEVIRRAQEGGHIPQDRDAEAEAWIFIAVGLLGALGQRLGLTEPDLQRIRAERRRWVTGRG